MLCDEGMGGLWCRGKIAEIQLLIQCGGGKDVEE